MQFFPFSFYYLVRWSYFIGLICLCVSCIDDESMEYTPVFDIPPTCSDGIQNQDETSVDCGGACSYYCGNTILASCTDDLESNHFENSTQSIDFDIGKIYSLAHYNGPLDIIGYDQYGHYKITITIPIKELPQENMKFSVGTSSSMYEDQLQARVKLESDDFMSYNYGYVRNSESGTLYIKFADEEMHIEFCEIVLNEEYFSYTQRLSGNINFLTASLDIESLPSKID